MACETFPVEVEPTNPAIQLFGNRLFADQAPTELLAELLLVVASPKRIGSGPAVQVFLPEWDQLKKWRRGQPLEYAPKARLNLKLFAFMAASRLDSRHQTHRSHYADLVKRLEAAVLAEPGTEAEVMRTLENLFLGFHGAGSGRTWCAQSFLPLSPALLASETIWAESHARLERPSEWDDVIENATSFFTSSKRLFFARGGEVLFLQLCNALRTSAHEVRAWVDDSEVDLAAVEQDPATLHSMLQDALGRLMEQAPRSLEDIAGFIDEAVESETSKATDRDSRGGTRWVQAGACASESWKEGYLFAVDLLRLCNADLDVVERVRLLESACAMQVLRTLAAQSARYSQCEGNARWPGYRWAVSAPEESGQAVKRMSRLTARLAERLVYHAIRSDGVPQPPPWIREKRLKEADRRYGGKLFIGLAKRIGFIVPRRGAGARFTLNEHLLRLLVVTTVPLDGRVTFERFKVLLEARHGLVFDDDGLSRANEWADGPKDVSFGGAADAWLLEMLAAAGMLVTLSDSCSLVENPAAKKGVES